MARILVVDDEPLVLSLSCHVLERAGHSVVAAMSVEHAEGALCDRPFDAMLCDVNLHDRSGVALLEHPSVVRDQTAVVVMSGAVGLPLAMDVIHRGAYDFIAKPLTPDALVASIEDALRRRDAKIVDVAHRAELERLVDERTADLTRALDQVGRAYDLTIEALGAALDLRDTETHQHCRNVEEISLRIAREYGITDPDRLRDLRWGALLHDIGKIGIPDAILRKPGRLTPGERMVVNTHPDLGSQMIRTIDFLAGASDVVRYHHERFDGSGYPEGLSGARIPISSRIFAIADAVDVLTTGRVYQAARSEAAVREEIVRCSGTHFDPRVVDAFVAVTTQSEERIA